MRYIIILLFLVSCREFKEPQEILKDYTEIRQLPTQMFDCTDDGKTHHSYSFRAIDSTGKEVKGVICYDFDGGHVVVIKKPL